MNTGIKRMVSGVKPTGGLTLGNYLGAIKPFAEYQEDYELFVFLADLHALTVYNDPDELRRNSEDLLAVYLAAGLDPEKACVFRQSDIPEHAVLEWILTCNTNLADLTKMPQYKDYLAKKGKGQVPAGILMYPSLMDADILLYNADYVPVGADQKPHVDLARDVAERFNEAYGNTFRIPRALITGAKIMSLSDPSKKMSKSESDRGTIYISDNRETIEKKIMQAVTDNDGEIRYDPAHKPGISNLLAIFAGISGIGIDEAERMFSGEKDYGAFKRTVANAVCAELLPLKAKAEEIKASGMLGGVLEMGKLRAQREASRALEGILRKIGLRQWANLG